MIDFKELRLGNIVNRKYWNPVPGNEHYALDKIEIESIKARSLNIKIGKIIVSKVKFEDVYPIPLSEEILLKLGMTNNHFRPERFDFEGVENGQFHIDQLNGRFVFRGLGMTIVYVDYLHDLQNLHFACKRTELNTSGL